MGEGRGGGGESRTFVNLALPGLLALTTFPGHLDITGLLELRI